MDKSDEFIAFLLDHINEIDPKSVPEGCSLLFSAWKESRKKLNDLEEFHADAIFKEFLIVNKGFYSGLISPNEENILYRKIIDFVYNQVSGPNEDKCDIVSWITYSVFEGPLKSLHSIETIKQVAENRDTVDDWIKFYFAEDKYREDLKRKCEIAARMFKRDARYKHA